MGNFCRSTPLISTVPDRLSVCVLLTTVGTPFQCNSTVRYWLIVRFCTVETALYLYTDISYQLYLFPSNFMNQRISGHRFISCHRQQNSIDIALSFSIHSSLGDGRVKIALQCRQEVYTAYSVLLRFHQSSNVPLADSSVKTLHSYIQLSCQKSHSFYPCSTVRPQTRPLSKVLKVCQAVMHYPWCWRLPFHDSVTY